MDTRNGADGYLSTLPAKSDNTSHNYDLSDFCWDGRYLRLKNVQVGYSLSKNVYRRLPLTSVRFFANAFNLLTWDKVKRVDPESNPDRNSGQFYPQQRIVNFE